MTIPNYFHYAKNELSQDAFFCWLIEWSVEKNKQYDESLYNTARFFLNFLLPHKINHEFLIHKCQIKQQYKNIDFIAILNDSLMLVFEDKINSSMGHNQLDKYSKIIKKQNQPFETYFFYIKTDLVWRHEAKKVITANYKLIDLHTTNNILSKYQGDNQIINDFKNSISNKLVNYYSYKTKSYEKWSKSEWLGFIYELSFDIEFSFFGKHYVGDNFWFILSWKDDFLCKDCNISLEIFSKKLVVKAHIKNKLVSKNDYRSKLIKIFKTTFKDYNYQIKKRIGKSMTILEFKKLIIESESNLDYLSTIIHLNSVKKLFDKLSG